jgi:hypothetical protein
MGLQDVVHAVALSEAVYKLVDVGPEGAVDHANSILSKLPPGVTTPLKFQCSVSTVSHRYVCYFICRDDIVCMLSDHTPSFFTLHDWIHSAQHCHGLCLGNLNTIPRCV